MDGGGHQPKGSGGTRHGELTGGGGGNVPRACLGCDLGQNEEGSSRNLTQNSTMDENGGEVARVEVQRQLEVATIAPRC
jgi:hypothetical protein